MTELEFHPVASIFPLLAGDDFRALVEDIRENGQLEPIWTYQGQIIDGRNRYMACRSLGNEAATREWGGNGSLLDFVVSMNLHRRHLTSSQRAAIAVEMLPMLEAEAEKRRRKKIGEYRSTGETTQLFEPSHGNGESAQHAAGLLDTNRQYVSDAKRLKHEEPELYERVLAGELSIPEAKRHVPGASQPVEVTVFSHKSVEYFTPPEFVEAARSVMGEIDLDPASCDEAQQTVGAGTYYTKDTDGLSQPWHGRVWLNPPYSKTGARSNQEIWSRRLADEYKAGSVTEAVLLVKAALGYNWFEELWYDWPVCFVKTRLSFIRENGDDSGQSKMGTALMYFGENVDAFTDVFREFGRVILPTDGYGPLRQ